MRHAEITWNGYAVTDQAGANQAAQRVFASTKPAEPVLAQFGEWMVETPDSVPFDGEDHTFTCGGYEIKILQH